MVMGLNFSERNGESNKSKRADIRSGGGADGKGQIEHTDAERAADPYADTQACRGSVPHLRSHQMVVHPVQGLAGFIGVAQDDTVRTDDGHAGVNCVTEAVRQAIDVPGVCRCAGERRGKQSAGEVSLRREAGPQLFDVFGFQRIQGEPSGGAERETRNDEIAEQDFPSKRKPHQWPSLSRSL